MGSLPEILCVTEPSRVIGAVVAIRKFRECYWGLGVVTQLRAQVRFCVCLAGKRGAVHGSHHVLTVPLPLPRRKREAKNSTALDWDCV